MGEAFLDVKMEESKVSKLLSQLTIDEKCTLLAGKNMWETACIPRLGIRSLKTTDGPAGVRGARWTDGTHTTFIPCGISLAATFNPSLIQRVGRILGQETKAKGAHVLLAPTMNISRSPFGGRNFENFGEDPFLTGKMATAYITGVQSVPGVGACMKHFVCNDAETRRFNMDQTIDERTLREIYLRPFEMVLQAGVFPWTAMTAYPKVNGVHLDMHEEIIKGILRDEWRYNGLVMSDWGGLNSTVQSIKATTDLEMPGPPIRYGEALRRAAEAGEVSESQHIDPSVTRVLQLLEKAGLLESSTPDSSPNVDRGDVRVEQYEIDSDTPEARRLAREAAQEGIVLLHNKRNILPLSPSKLKRVAILGPNAKKSTAGGTGSAIVNPYYVTNPYTSLSEALKSQNPDIELSYERGIYTYLQPPLAGPVIRNHRSIEAEQGMRVDFYSGTNFEGDIVATTYWHDSLVYLMSDGDTPEQLRGTVYSYRATGIIRVPQTGVYNFSFSSTGKAKLLIQGELAIDNTEWSEISGNFMNCGSKEVFAKRDLVANEDYEIVFENIAVPPPTKPHDNTLFHKISGVRMGLMLQYDEDVLFANAVNAARNADIAVVVVGHNNDTEREGSDRSSLSLPGRTDEFVAAVCAANPQTVVVSQSACAITMPWAADAGAVVHAWYQGQENGNALADVLCGVVNPGGKLPITFPKQIGDHGSHRWFPGNVPEDTCEYGEGILVGYKWFDSQNIEPLWPFGFGLSYTTFDVSSVAIDGNAVLDKSNPYGFNIKATVTNTGNVDGSETVQVYVDSTPQDGKNEQIGVQKCLADFSKVYLVPGQSEIVTFQVDWTSLRRFDEEGWTIKPGTYSVHVGTSSRDIAATLCLHVV